MKASKAFFWGGRGGEVLKLIFLLCHLLQSYAYLP